MPNVSAVVLTYNRKDLLQDCLAAILAQTHPCDRILVLDNGSSDGTAECVAQRFGDAVEVYRLPQNTGASGGFNMAVRIAYQRGDDLLWLMDDDVIPAPDALEELVAADTFLTNSGIEAPFVISTALGPDGMLLSAPEIDLTARNKLGCRIWPTFLEHSLIPVRRTTFASMLLKRNTVRRYGVPIAQMYMWGEDAEYTRRITHQQEAYLVGTSQVVHARAIAGVLDIRTERDPVRIGWHYFHGRNAVYIARRFFGRKAATRRIRNAIKLSLELLRRGEARKAKILLSGSLAGLFFNPKIDGVDVPIDIGALRIQLGHPRSHEEPFGVTKRAARPKARATASSRPSRI